MLAEQTDETKSLVMSIFGWMQHASGLNLNVDEHGEFVDMKCNYCRILGKCS